MSSPTPSVRSHEVSSAAPAPIAEALNVAPTVPVILYHDPANADQVDGVTWDGAARGRVATTGARRGVVPNPAGTLYAAFRDRAIYDRSGRLVDPNPSEGLLEFGTWADDGSHYCQFDGAPPSMLVLGAVGEQARNIGRFGLLTYPPVSAACSITRDQAIFVADGGGHPTLFWVGLSTGRVLRTHSYPPPPGYPEQYFCPYGHVVVSRDGQYFADVCFEYVDDHLLGRSTVHGADGSILAHVAGQITSFSWDGSLAVVDNAVAPPSVVRWRDSRVIWKAPDGVTLWNALPEPDGPRVAVAVLNGIGQSFIRGTYRGWPMGLPPEDLYVVEPNGLAVELLKMTSIAFPVCPRPNADSGYGNC
jgi:hypothetical protein